MMTLTLLDLAAIAVVVAVVNVAIIYAVARRLKSAVSDAPMLSGMIGGD